MATCPTCGNENPTAARYCSACGAALDAPRREERKVVTILFCDLVDFTARFDAADPEDVRATLAAYHARVRREIERFGGTMEKFIGDAVVAVYGAPLTREDDAQRAVLSGLRIPPAIEELNESNPDTPLAVRIGIETGEAVITVGSERAGHGIAIGDVVNTASRLQALAPTGKIIVGQTTYQLTRDLVEYEPLEPVEVKGKSLPLSIWVAKGPRSRFGADLQRTPSTPFIDRDDELELLKRIFSLTVREPSVQLVTLMGEPGVGKSRVVLEFFAFVDDLHDLVFWRQGRCLPYGEGVSFWALAGIVKAHAGILDSDGRDEASSKLEASVAAVIEDAGEREWVRTRLAPLMGLDAQPLEGVDRIESFSAWRRYLEAIAGVYPLVLAIEDLHWGNPALLDFIEHVLDWSSHVPILVLCTARPELFERNERWGGGKRNSSVMSLPPLSDADTDRLILPLLPAGISSSVRRDVVERSGGNPLFAEEFARALREGAAPVASSSIGSPATLQALIAARLDTLPLSQKALLQDASVMGSLFWPGALAAMSGADLPDVRERLRELTRRDLIRPSRVSSVENEAEYAFSHGLIREVAYGQIPRVARAKKHVAAARWTEEMAGERISDHAEVLAHHYGRAFELTASAGIAEGLDALEDSTRHYWMIAGERAMSLDVSRAEQFFDRALRHLRSSHPDRPRALASKAEACLDGGRYEDAERLYKEAIDGFRAVGDLVGLGAALDRLATVLWERGDAENCRQKLAEAVDVLERQPPGPELVHCYATVASDHLVTGRFEGCVQWSDRALEIAGKLSAEALEPRAIGYRGMARIYLGDMAGLQDLERGIELAERYGVSRQHAQLLVILAEVLWPIDGPDKALKVTSDGTRFAERRGVMDEAVACRTLSLGPLFDLGRWDELDDVADGILRFSERAGGDYSAVLAEPWSAQTRLLRGDVAQAKSLISRTIPRAREIADAQVVVPAIAIGGLVDVYAGRAAEAGESVGALMRDAEETIGWYREQFLVDLVRVCSMAGRLDVARRLVDTSRSFAARHGLSVTTAGAIIDEALGHHEAALTGYENAVKGWSNFGHVLETGMALFGSGRCLIRLDRSGGSERIRRARDTFAKLGADLLVGETKAYL